MKIEKEILQLVEAGVITSETGARIKAYYGDRGGQVNNRLNIIFGVLGALLVGLGILLILAHNWDELSRGVKTFIAFLPLVLGQSICLYVLLKRSKDIAWREGAAAFLFCAVGVCLSLISQIYHISGETSDFVLMWMILCVPLIYVMRSSIISLMYIIGITFYGVEAGYWNAIFLKSYLYWGLLALMLPHYIKMYRDRSRSNFMIFHNWMIPLSMSIVFITLSHEIEEIIVLSYVCLFGLFIQIGKLPYFDNQKTRDNGYLLIGSLGLILLLLGVSFDAYWNELIRSRYGVVEILKTPSIWTTLVTTLFALILLVSRIKRLGMKGIMAMEPVFLVFIVIFFLGIWSGVSVILINILLFALALLTILKGSKERHLGILNYGLLIMAALLVCRFFDTDISFVVRGILFVIIGIGFFMANMWMVRKRKQEQENILR